MNDAVGDRRIYSRGAGSGDNVRATGFALRPKSQIPDPRVHQVHELFQFELRL